MTAIHARSELVEPLLLALPFRHTDAFRASQADRGRAEILRQITLVHHLDAAALAEGLRYIAHLDGQDWDGKHRLHKAICDDAGRWLTLDGDSWALRIEPRRPGHEIVRWRALTMLLPPSIVIAGALATSGRTCPRSVRALPASIAPHAPVGHLHLHLGPMIPFETLWFGLWTAFLTRGSLDAPGNPGIAAVSKRALPDIAVKGPHDQPGLGWQWLLELAMMARGWLELRLRRGTPSTPRTLRCLSLGAVDLEDRRRSLLALWADDGMACWLRRRALDVLRDRDRRLRDEASLWERSGAKSRTMGGAPSSDRQASHDCDAEIDFMARALSRCFDEKESSDGVSFERVFYQYLRVKVALYSKLVVDPWTRGLRHFLDVVKRDKPYTKVIDDESGLRTERLGAARRELPLRVGPLEIHTLPESWLREDPRADRHVRHGWILSIVRSASQDEDESDGRKGACKWRRHADEQAAYCRAIRRRIEERPTLLGHLRGVSLMDWERNGPVWLFEPQLRRLVHASRRAAARHPGRKLQPLRTALHLGEDFDHVLTGLRQIYEPFAWGLIGRGDRIGHALALGLDPRRWLKDNPWIRARPWDRLLDVGFIAWAVADRGLRVSAGGIDRLRASATDCFARIFARCEGEPLEAARHVWLSLPVTQRPAGETLQPLSCWATECINKVMDDPAVGERALSLSLSFEPRLDLPVILAVHRFVHRHVAEMQVAIEINPSSNLLVGGFRSIFEQPVFHFADLPIIIGADDPLSFATTLADDYAYAWAGMVLHGAITPMEATRRLEEAGRTSIRYAFGGPGSAKDTDGPSLR